MEAKHRKGPGYKGYTPSRSCSGCGKRMSSGGSGGLPQGQAICRECRGMRPQPPKSVKPPKRCAVCAVEIPAKRVYCDPCRDERRTAPWSRRPINTPEAIERARQYKSKEHKAERRRVLALVESGEAFCWRCGQHIPPGMPVHAGHDDYDRSIYRGAECPPCNIRGAAIKGNRSSKRKPLTFLQRRAASVIPEDRACAGCGVVFTIRWPDQKYCGRPCVWANRPSRPGRGRKLKVRAPSFVLAECSLCGDAFLSVRGAVMCSDECRVEQNRRVNRDRYRARVGLPVDPSKPTKRWRVSKVA